MLFKKKKESHQSTITVPALLDDLNERLIPIEKDGEFHIGRDESCDITFSAKVRGDDAHEDLLLRVSRHHAILSRTPSGIFIRDNGSTQGTTVNGNPLMGTKEKLEPNDLVAFGDFWKLRFVMKKGHPVQETEVS